MTNSSLCVALTGATGFVGRHVLARLLVAGHRVRVLARDPDRLKAKDSRVHPVSGDLFDDKALAELVDRADAVIHLVGIIMQIPRKGQTFDRIHTQGTERLVAAAKCANVRRWVHMSALGTRPNAISAYHRTKWQGELAVRNSGFDYTIFRPSIIHGPDGEFMSMVKNFCCDPMPPFMPYFGAGITGQGGAGRLQPVWVEDVAECFVSSLTRDHTIGETYPLGGPDAYTWPQLYQICRDHIPGARDKKPMAVPAWLAMKLSKLPMTPFGPDQVIMSQEDSTCEIHKAQNDFAIDLKPFEPTLAEYASRIEYLG